MDAPRPGRSAAFKRLVEAQASSPSVWTLTGDADYLLRGVYPRNLAALNDFDSERALPIRDRAGPEPESSLDQLKATALPSNPLKKAPAGQ